MVTLTTGELAAMEDDVATGKLPKDAVKQHFKDEEKHVFGFDVKHDRKGNPIEQGLGSPGHETGNHFISIRKYEGEDAYWSAVAEIWKRDPERAKKLSLPPAKKAA